MGYRIITTTPDSVTFEVAAQKHRAGRFTMPKEVRELLGVGFHEKFRLRIESRDGHPRWEGISQMQSGPEIYVSELAQKVGAGERIRVVASRL